MRRLFSGPVTNPITSPHRAAYGGDQVSGTTTTLPTAPGRGEKCTEAKLEDQIEIRIVHSTGGSHDTIHVNQSASIGDLKQLVGERKGLSPNKIRLVHYGGYLEGDELPLAAIGIHSGATIHVVVKMGDESSRGQSEVDTVQIKPGHLEEQNVLPSEATTLPLPRPIPLPMLRSSSPSPRQSPVPLHNRQADIVSPLRPIPLPMPKAREDTPPSPVPNLLPRPTPARSGSGSPHVIPPRPNRVDESENRGVNDATTSTLRPHSPPYFETARPQALIPRPIRIEEHENTEAYVPIHPQQLHTPARATPSPAFAPRQAVSQKNDDDRPQHRMPGSFMDMSDPEQDNENDDLSRAPETPEHRLNPAPLPSRTPLPLHQSRPYTRMPGAIIDAGSEEEGRATRVPLPMPTTRTTTFTRPIAQAGLYIRPPPSVVGSEQVAMANTSTRSTVPTPASRQEIGFNSSQPNSRSLNPLNRHNVGYAPAPPPRAVSVNTTIQSPRPQHLPSQLLSGSIHKPGHAPLPLHSNSASLVPYSYAPPPPLPSLNGAISLIIQCGNRSVNFILKRNATILDIKKMLLSETGAPVRRQMLSFDGLRLVNHWTLPQCGILKDDTMLEFMELSEDNIEDADLKKPPPCARGFGVEVGPSKFSHRSYARPEPKRALVDVYVKTLTNKTIALLDVPLEKTVLYVKEMVESKEGVSIAQQRLILSGSEIEDFKTLKSYDLPKQATFHLVLRNIAKPSAHGS